jgi:hypothetical protein
MSTAPVVVSAAPVTRRSSHAVPSWSPLIVLWKDSGPSLTEGQRAGRRAGRMAGGGEAQVAAFYALAGLIVAIVPAIQSRAAA